MQNVVSFRLAENQLAETARDILRFYGLKISLEEASNIKFLIKQTLIHGRRARPLYIFFFNLRLYTRVHANNVVPPITDVYTKYSYM